MKHLRRRKRPVWILYLLAVIALALAIWAVSTLFFGEKNTKPNDNPGGNAGVTDPSTPDISDDKPDATAARTAALLAADTLAKGYFYDEALAQLTADPSLMDDSVQAKITEIEAQKAALVKYEGQSYHVFFHSLILYPELAFDNKGHPADGYNLWMTTQKEFIAMLPALLENDFVLYDITNLVKIDASGKAVKQDIYLPAGKKPLIISIDDVNYYDYMKPDGFAEKLVINEKGDVVTRVVAPDGTVSDTYDGDVMPIVDEFVKAHPEFSYRGAKGIVATTGYAGAFGYRITDLELFSKAEGDKMLADVTAIAKRLRETGWQIANHSYTHNSYFRDGSITMQELQSDVTRWKTLIEPYVGQTPIFISPFGVHFGADDPIYKYIVSQGFYIYCPVAANMSTTYRENSMVQERLNLDGYTMLTHPQRISKALFDPASIVDKARPPMK